MKHRLWKFVTVNLFGKIRTELRGLSVGAAVKGYAGHAEPVVLICIYDADGCCTSEICVPTSHARALADEILHSARLL